MKNKMRDGMYGLISGDALGVPVEFTSREIRQADPVVGMRAYGTHNQPAGTWSDDSSMALATLDSIKKENEELNFEEIMLNISNWALWGDYSPFAEVFDIGNTCVEAIKRWARNTPDLPAIEAGAKEFYKAGNGSLMRILPVSVFLINKQKESGLSDDEIVKQIHDASALTHANIICKMACGIFHFCSKAIIEGRGPLITRLQDGVVHAFAYYTRDEESRAELGTFSRIGYLDDFKKLDEGEIRSTGYVVDTLEAALWCLCNETTFEATLLKAVNLGDDTDTVGAVTGALAGLYYGYDNIPQQWLDDIQRKDIIDEILNK